MKRLRPSFVIVLLLSAAACGSGSKKLQLGGACVLNTDCKDPLVCKLGACHQGCTQSRDCASGERCVLVDNIGVCQLATEAACAAYSPRCQTPLVCAADNLCRNSCTVLADCMRGQECVDKVCLESSEAAGWRADGGVGHDAGTTLASDGGGRSDVGTTIQGVDATIVQPDGAAAVLDAPSDTKQDGGTQPDAGKDSRVTPADTAKLDAAKPDVFVSPDTAIKSPDGASGEAGPVSPVACTGASETLTFDGSALPGSSAAGSTWSYNPGAHGSWTSNGTELIMSTSQNVGIWFGNSPDYTKASWKIAPPGEGNSLSIRCKLGPNSQGFHAYFLDASGVMHLRIYFMPGYVLLTEGYDGTLTRTTRHNVDTSVYHTYVLKGEAWTRSYSIDGVEILQEQLPPKSATGTPYLIIGDSSGPDPDPVVGWESGTFHIDEVVFKTRTSCVRH